jgi:hypothetical protein
VSNRYWIGGTGDWSDTAHWDVHSGGAGGDTIPTSSDDVFIDSASGFGAGGTITMTESSFCCDMTLTSGHSYTINCDSNNFAVSGSLTLEIGMTMLDPNDFVINSQNTESITSNGATLDELVISGTGSFTVQDDLHITNGFYQENGTFDANDHNVIASEFYFYADTGFTPTVIMGSGTWEATGTGNVWYIDEYNAQVVTITKETSVIKLTNATVTAKTFMGGGKTYNNIWFTGAGTGTFDITGSNTFNDLKIDAGLTITFLGGTTQVVSSFSAIGTAINPITIDSSVSKGVVESIDTTPAVHYGNNYQVDDVLTIFSGGDGNATVLVTAVDTVDIIGAITGLSLISGGTNYVTGLQSLTGGTGTGGGVTILSLVKNQHILSKSSGIVSCDYLDLSNSNAIGGATWYAGSHSADTTNNDGWIFADAPPSLISPLPSYKRV